MIVDGWFSWMDRDPGPSDKTYSEPCTSEIVVPHDAVGYYPGWMSRLKSADRLANGRYTPYAAASVTGWLPYADGEKPIQHYRITESCWASGSRFLNVKGNAFENESAPIMSVAGIWYWAGTTARVDWHNPPPQSDWQVECLVRVINDLSEHFNRPVEYWRVPVSGTDVTATLYLHKETIRWGGRTTSCPNFRVDRTRILGALRPPVTLPEGDDMPFDDEEKAYLASMARGIVRALATGAFTSTLGGDLDYTQAEHSLKEVLDKVPDESAPADGRHGHGEDA